MLSRLRLVKLLISLWHKYYVKTLRIRARRRRNNGIVLVSKKFYGLADMPTSFQQTMNNTLLRRTTAWQNYFVIVNRSGADTYLSIADEVFKFLEDEGYKANKASQTSWKKKKLNGSDTSLMIMESNAIGTTEAIAASESLKKVKQTRFSRP